MFATIIVQHDQFNWKFLKIYLLEFVTNILHAYYLRKPHRGFVRPSLSSFSNTFIRASFNLRLIPFPTCKIEIKNLEKFRVSNIYIYIFHITIKPLYCLLFFYHLAHKEAHFLILWMLSYNYHIIMQIWKVSGNTVQEK